MSSDKMSPAVKALILRNLRATLADLQAKEFVNSKQQRAVIDELARAERGEW